jgi:hypothetical protein
VAIDLQLAARALELVRRAKALGMADADIAGFAGRPDDLEAEIERRIAARSSGGWYDVQIANRIRRKKIAAAYLAGASLNQLATLEQITAKAIHDLVAKELPQELRERVARERTAAGRRREPTFRPSQVSAMMALVSDEDVMKLPVVVIAARMAAAANAEQDMMEAPPDEDDPYLRNEAGTPATRTSEGSE